MTSNSTRFDIRNFFVNNEQILYIINPFSKTCFCITLIHYGKPIKSVTGRDGFLGKLRTCVTRL